MTSRRADPKVLFVAHEASRTGAPIVLLHFLRWLRNTHNLKFAVLLKSGGPLESSFRELGPTFVSPGVPRGANLINRLTRGRWRNVLNRRGQTWVTRVAQQSGASAVYGNTAVVWEELRTLTSQGLPAIWHIHELGYIIRGVAGAEFPKVAAAVSRIVAAAEVVKSCLTENFAVPASQVEVVHEFIEPLMLEQAERERLRSKARHMLGIPPDAFVAGGCGTIEWRKGPDLFCATAVETLAKAQGKEIHFVWIGGDPKSDKFEQVLHDAATAGFSANIHFTGPLERPMETMLGFDVFCLTSREDPFPLVMLEAASCGLPVVCFAQSGGAPEFVEADAGCVVPYLSVTEMSQALLKLGSRPDWRRQLGSRAQEKVATLYTTSHQAPKLLELIYQVSSGMAQPSGADQLRSLLT